MEAATADRPASAAQLSLEVGGREPTSGTLTLVGGAHDVEVDYDREDVVRVEIEAVVRKVGFSDIVDAKTGAVVGTKRQHQARILSFRVID